MATAPVINSGGEYRFNNAPDTDDPIDCAIVLAMTMLAHNEFPLPPVFSQHHGTTPHRTPSHHTPPCVAVRHRCRASERGVPSAMCHVWCEFVLECTIIESSENEE